MTTPRYATPQAFKQALEQRLRSASASGVDIARRRQLLVFERFLARRPEVVLSIEEHTRANQAKKQLRKEAKRPHVPRTP